MPSKQGNLALLNDPIAQELLQSKIPARLAYVWTDGTPRVTPVWFHWNGEEIVIGTVPGTPKLKALVKNPKVALTIDTEGFPAKVLMIRGTVKVEMVEQVPEYADCATRYLGKEQGMAWMEQTGGLFTEMGRIVLTPEWVAVQDFQTRFPNAIEVAMEKAMAATT